MIKVKLFATFREGRQKEVIFNYFEGINGRYILDKLDIKEEDVAIYLVNGLDGKIDNPLNDGDTISLFPPVGGGWWRDKIWEDMKETWICYQRRKTKG